MYNKIFFLNSCEKQQKEDQCNTLTSSFLSCVDIFPVETGSGNRLSLLPFFFKYPVAIDLHFCLFYCKKQLLNVYQH